MRTRRKGRIGLVVRLEHAAQPRPDDPLDEHREHTGRQLSQDVRAAAPIRTRSEELAGAHCAPQARREKLARPLCPPVLPHG